LPVHIVTGGFFGDEGKGKVTSFLSITKNPIAVVRTGATNAGHTVVFKGKIYKLRSVPSGFIYDKARLYIARGSLIEKSVFLEEIKRLGLKGRIWIDGMTGIINEAHKEREMKEEHFSRLGSTKSGVGAAMSDRVLRRLRLAREYDDLKEYVKDTQEEVLDAVEGGGLVIVEASQGYWLSLYHGTYPYVTSRDTTASGCLSEIGLGPKHAERITVVFKSYVTRVGPGPLPNELDASEAERKGWVEVGTVTGRRRRVAYFNFELARKAIKANSATDAAITKIDSIFPKSYHKRSWDELPKEAKKWIKEVEQELGVPISIIGTGAEVFSVVSRNVYAY